MACDTVTCNCRVWSYASHKAGCITRQGACPPGAIAPPRPEAHSALGSRRSLTEVRARRAPPIAINRVATRVSGTSRPSLMPFRAGPPIEARRDLDGRWRGRLRGQAPAGGHSARRRLRCDGLHHHLSFHDPRRRGSADAPSDFPIRSERFALPESVVEKADYRPEERAALTVTELERWLTLEIAGVYHHAVHTALGTSPLAAWRDGLARRASHPVNPATDRHSFSIFCPVSVDSCVGTAFNCFGRHVLQCAHVPTMTSGRHVPATRALCMVWSVGEHRPAGVASLQCRQREQRRR